MIQDLDHMMENINTLIIHNLNLDFQWEKKIKE